MAEFSHDLAVFIGINQYGNGLSSLQSAVNDVRAIAHLLRQDHQYEIESFIDQQATLLALEQLLTETLPQKVKPNSRLLFYFAGHGIALNGEDGPQGYLIPQDAVAGNTRSYLPMPVLHDALSQLPCRHFLGILDCCFAGAFRWSNTREIKCFPQVIHRERYDRFIQDSAWQVLTSAAHDQTALDAFTLQGDRGCTTENTTDQFGEHSPFAAALIEALQGGADAYPPPQKNQPAGDGIITATELYLYLRDRVEIATESRHLRQTPGLYPLKQHDKGEFIFLRPNHPLNLPLAPPLDVSQNPYRGLQSFESQHSELFFGRSDLVDSLQGFVKEHALTVVLGASGSGKSSLVKAGLIPQLNQAHSEQWHILPPIRPGEKPFQSLNKALQESGLRSVMLGHQKETLAYSVVCWADTHPNTKLLIFIDQSEEIITLCTNETVKQAFFQQLLIAINAHRDKLRIVLSLRSDFEPQVRDTGLASIPTELKQVSNTELKQRWQQGRFFVPAMTRAELREVIEKPAESRVMYFQPHSLVDQLVEEVADMPGALPLLSFALSELYLKYLERQHNARYQGQNIDRALTQSDYQALGGVIQSLTQRADEEYQALVSENSDYAQVIRHVMLRLVAFNGGELARRRVRLSELIYSPGKNSLSNKAITRLTQARLLVEGQDIEGNACVEAAHDALIRGWYRLQNWLAKEKNLKLQRRLTVSATEWEHQRQSQFLWHTNPYLDVLDQEVLHAADNNWLNQLETNFVKQSLRKRRKNNITRWSLVGIAFILLSSISGLATKFAVNVQNSSIAASGSLAKSMFTSNKGLEALAQAVAAGEQLGNMPRFLLAPKAEGEVIHALQETLYGIKERKRFGHGAAVTSIGFSPKTQVIATGLNNGTIMLRNIEGEVTQTLSYDTDNVLSAVYKVAFANDGKTLISMNQTQGVRIWEKQSNGLFEYSREINSAETIMSVAVSESTQMLATAHRPSDTITLWNLEGRKLATFGQGKHSDRINSLSFSPDGKMLVTGSGDKTIRIWDISRNNQLARTIAADNKITTVNFIDEQTFASGSLDGTISLWKTDGTEQELSGRHRGQVHNIATDNNNKFLVSGGQDQTVNIWDLEDNTLLETFNGHTDEVTSVSFIEANDIVMSASIDESVRLWKVSNKEQVPTGQVIDFSRDNQTIATAQGNQLNFWMANGTLKQEIQAAHSKIIQSIRFSPKANLLASADREGIIKIWSAEGEPLREFVGHQDFITSLCFSPDGKILVSGSGDGDIKLWATEGHLIDTWTVGSTITSLAFSPNGKMIVSAGHDDTAVRLWNLNGTSREKDPIGSDVLDVEFSPDGKKIAAAGTDGYITLWHLNQASPLHRFWADKDSIRRIKFSPEGKRLLSGGSDGSVKQWTLKGELINTLYEYDNSVADIALSRQGKTMASVPMIPSNNGSVIVIRDFSLQGLMESSKQFLGDFPKDFEIQQRGSKSNQSGNKF